MAPAARRLGVVAAAAALLLLVGVPLFQLLSEAVVGGWEAAAAVRDARTTRPVVNTLWTSAVVTVLTLVLAGAAAWVTERAAVPGRRWLRLGLLLPLLVPPYVSALGWARAYGPAGLSDRLLGVALPGVFGPGGVVTVITVNAVPLAYVIVAAALTSRAEPEAEHAARASGAGPWTVVRTVTLPLLVPALVAAGGLVFVLSANAFGVPAVLGRPAGFATVTTRIYSDLVLSADLAAFARVAVLASGLVALAVVVVGAVDAVAGTRFRAVRTALPVGSSVPASRRGRWLAAIAWVYVVAVVVLPLAALALLALSRAVGLGPAPANWTLANLTAALAGPGWQALRNSVLLALLASAGALALGGLLAAVGRRGPLGSAAILTFAVPGSALAVAVLLAYGPRLRDTLALILVAYLAKFWALGHRSIAGALDGLPPDLLRAARTSGAGPAAAARTVTVPLLRPAIAAGGLLVFVFALHELTMSALLYGPGTQTLAVVILNLNQVGDIRATAALAVLLTLASLLVAAAGLLLRRRWSAW